MGSLKPKPVLGPEPRGKSQPLWFLGVGPWYCWCQLTIMCDTPPPPHSYRLFKHRYAHTYISICTRTSKCMHVCICIPRTHTHTCSCVSAPRGVLILSKTAVSSRFKGSTGAGELYQALAVAQKPSFLCGYRCGWLSKLGSRFGYPK